MKIKVGDKLPSSELFYLDQSNNVKKIDILDLCRNNKLCVEKQRFEAFSQRSSFFYSLLVAAILASSFDSTIKVLSTLVFCNV